MMKQASGIGLARAPTAEKAGWMQYFQSYFEAVVPSAAVELRDCLIENFSAERLEGTNKYRCDNCDELRDAQKWESISK